MCNNRSFLEGKTAAQRRAKWDHIAATLNATGPFSKDGKGWQQLWRDWRYRVRSRAREMKRMHATGGGCRYVVTEQGATPVDISSHLSGLDQRVMTLVGWDTVATLAGGIEVSPAGNMEEPFAAPASETEPAPCTSAGLAIKEEPVAMEEVCLAKSAPPASEPKQQETHLACRRRRKRLPPSIAAEVLEEQRRLVEEQKKLVVEQRKMVECMTTLCQMFAPVSEYFALMLEKERAKHSS